MNHYAYYGNELWREREALLNHLLKPAAVFLIPDSPYCCLDTEVEQVLVEMKRSEPIIMKKKAC